MSDDLGSGTQAATPDQNRRSATISAPAARLGAGDRYELFELIAEGGMGAVYRGWDAVLRRDVAVKVMRDAYAHLDAARRRFEYEAYITAQLQHPNVPPVHDLGTTAGGAPFLALKLVGGSTLDKLLKARPDPGYDRGRFLTAFEAVAQAVGYAHSRGVIHRDLKPQNVMVGEFGEVQVMDWGIAKFRDAEPPPLPPGPATAGSAEETHTLVQPAPAGDATRTVAGTVLGTPPYMPPEQARGEVEAVTERSDVFGLGAVLCAILTGRPPFVGDGLAHTVRLAAAGDLTDAFARLDGCGADADLVALAKRCLAPAPVDRFATGGEVAAAVAAYRAGVEARLRAAEVEQARAAAKAAEARKRRRVARALAAVVVALVALTAGGLWWADQQAEARRTERAVRAAATRSAVESALARADAAVRAGKVDEADVVLTQAEARLAEHGEPDLQEQFAELRADVRTVRDLDAAADNRWALRHDRTGHEQERAAYRAAFARYALGSPEAGERVKESRVVERLVAGLDELLAIGPDEAGVVAALAAADPDPFRTEVRAALAKQDLKRVRDLVAAVDGGTLPPAFAAAVGSRTVLPQPDAERLLRPAYARHRDNFPLALALGAACMRPYAAAGPDDGVGFFRAAVALRPSNLRARLMLTLAYSTRDQHAAAIAEAEAAVALAPGVLRARNALAAAYYQAQRYADAEVAYRAVVAAGPTGRVAGDAWLGLGGCRFDVGDYAAAADAYRAAAQHVPDDVSAVAYLGEALDAMGQSDAALAAYRRAADRAPPELTYPAYRLAEALRDRRRAAEAVGLVEALVKQTDIIAEEVYPVAIEVTLEAGNFRRARELAEAFARVAPPEARPRAENYGETATTYQTFAAAPPAELAKVAANQAPEGLLPKYRLAEFYRITGRPAEAFHVYRQVFRQATRFGIGLPYPFYLNAARAALAGDAPPEANRRLAAEWLFAAAGLIGERNTQMANPLGKRQVRKAAVLMLSEPAFRAVRDVKNLPGPERETCDRLWAAVRAVAARPDNPPRETAPPPRAP